MKIKFLFVIIFIINWGCAKIVHRIDVLSEENTTTSNSFKKNSHTECSQNQFEFLLENKTATSFYLDLFKKSDFDTMSFNDKALSISLIEMLRRPDTVSPGSRLQVIFKSGENLNYYDFSTNKLKQKVSQPYLFGIDFLSKKYKGTSIAKLATKLDLLLPNSLPVDISLENFLKTNSKEIMNIPLLNSQFFKAEDFLTHFENFERSKLVNIVSRFSMFNSSDFNIEVDKLDFNSTSNLKSKIQCNFDIDADLEKNEILSENEKTHYFGLRDGKNFFIAIISSLNGKKIKTLENSELQFVTQPQNPIPVCRFTANEIDLFISSITGKGRIQHLKHLKDYEIYNSKNYSAIQDVLNFPRHIFLTSPDRILYESKKGRKDQLNFFLSMNFPIYHVDNIGEVIGATLFKKNNYYSLISDSRSKASVLCTK